jgi:hypothetical protein
MVGTGMWDKTLSSLFEQLFQNSTVHTEENHEKYQLRQTGLQRKLMSGSLRMKF